MSQVAASVVLPCVRDDSDKPDADTERQWVRALARGDAAAFDAVYAAHHEKIFSFLLRLAKSRDAADDLTQQTWMRFAKSARSLREDTSFGPLLFTIARNVFRNHHRWAILDISRILTYGFETITLATPEPSPDIAHERACAVALLEAALARLPVAHREVLLLVGVEGLDQPDVATILGISYDALRQRLRRARDELAVQIEKLETEPRAERSAPPVAKPGEIG